MESISTSEVESSSLDSPAVDPSDLLAAALNSSDVSEEELAVVDATLDTLSFAEDLKVGRTYGTEPLLSLEEAQAKLDPEILEVLSKKFKGSLTQVRHLDERDQLF